jgi:hypothetical protein
MRLISGRLVTPRADVKKHFIAVPHARKGNGGVDLQTIMTSFFQELAQTYPSSSRQSGNLRLATCSHITSWSAVVWNFLLVVNKPRRSSLFPKKQQWQSRHSKGAKGSTSLFNFEAGPDWCCCLLMTASLRTRCHHRKELFDIFCQQLTKLTTTDAKNLLFD